MIYDINGKLITLPNGNGSSLPLYNATDYGLSVDNVDNTNAFQSLIDMVNANGGGTIYIPNGKYTFSATNTQYLSGGTGGPKVIIKPKPKVSFVGESASGVVFDIVGSNNNVSFMGYSGGLDGVIYENFTVDYKNYISTGSYTTGEKALISKNITNSVFRNLRLLNTPATALGIDYLHNVIIDGIYCYNCGWKWTGNGSGGAGIGIGTGAKRDENIIITNCICDGCGHFGIFVEDQAGAFATDGRTDGNEPRGQIISNNIIRNSKFYGIGVRGGQNVLVTNNVVYDSLGGLYVDAGAKEIMFTNNLVQNCTEAGFNFGDETARTCESIVVKDNSFFDNAVAILKTVAPTNPQINNNIFVGNTVDEQTV